MLGSIEAGGTKFVCAVGNDDYEIVDSITVPTTTPEETFGQCLAFFEQYRKQLVAVSIASFGPIEIRPDAPQYGYITNTPKPGWANTDFLGPFKRRLGVPTYWTTDVNGSAYGEYVLAKSQGKSTRSLVYYTVGTGVGAGAVVNGHLIGAMGHPEMGHLIMKRHPDDLAFNGICPYHGDCLEGLACGPTFEARTGKKGQDIPLTDHVWDIMAYYVAQAAVDVTVILRPDRLIFGGGVVSEGFLKKVRHQFTGMFNDYLDIGKVDDYIMMPLAAHNGSATVGNFALAKALVKNDK